MNNKAKQAVQHALIAGSIFALFILFFADLSFITISSQPPEKLSPSAKVLIVQDQTVIENGAPCRVTKAAFVSTTGPKNEPYWHKVPHFFFPTYTLVAVIYSDGNLDWQPSYRIQTTPPDPKLHLCVGK